MARVVDDAAEDGRVVVCGFEVVLSPQAATPTANSAPKATARTRGRADRADGLGLGFGLDDRVAP